MIVKFYELNKKKISFSNFLLFYGKNEGFKKQEISKIKIANSDSEIINYEEKEIVDNENNFFETAVNGSLFEKNKVIIINRATDKIYKIIEDLSERNRENLIVILNSENLEKKSKLRMFFEKHKEFFCCAFYPDTDQTLNQLAHNYLNEKKISLSSINLNLIVNKCRGDRGGLLNELNKLELYCKNGKKLDSKKVQMLTNLSEDYSISELVDNCLAKNNKKTINILNENNFGHDDCIIILRTFLYKSKKILKLLEKFEENNDINLTISSAKPPIFWKDKEITKKQITEWTTLNIKKLIYNLAEVELNIKKNLNCSIDLTLNFIIEQLSLKSNN